MIDVDELERLHGALKGGSWAIERVSENDHPSAADVATFIITAHNLMPAIIAELRQARMVGELLERCSEFRLYVSHGDWFATATVKGKYMVGEGDSQAEAIDALWQQVMAKR